MKKYLNLETKGKESPSGEVNYKCPICNRWELTWNVIEHIGVCWGCKKGYNQHSIKKLTTISYISTQMKETKEQVIEKYVPPLITTELPPQALAFLLGDKNFDEDMLKYVRWCEEKRSVCFPIVNVDPHNLNYEIANMYRSIDLKAWRIQEGQDKANFIYNPHHFIPAPHNPEYTKHLFIVEGIFDAISLAFFVNVISILGSTLYDNQAEFIKKRHYNRGQKIVLWLDPDKAGKKGRLEIIDRLRFSYGIVPDIIEDPEPNDYTQYELGKKLNYYWNL